jgi:hypothetical protein
MKHSYAACMVLLIAACASEPTHVHAALIIHPDAASRAELLDAVTAALNHAPVSLADDALVHDSVLLIERQPRLDPTGVQANGRELGMPERFLLASDGRHCVLTHDRTRRHWVLTHTQCKARE